VIPSLYGAAVDSSGDVHFVGKATAMAVGQTGAFSIGGGPTLTLGAPFYAEITPGGTWVRGFSLQGSSQNSFTSVTTTNGGDTWVAGLYYGGSVGLGNFIAPDVGTDGQGGLVFRVSASGTVDWFNGYPGGYFQTLDADGTGFPTVAGVFRGPVDFGVGTLPIDTPTVVIARLDARRH
jgi:hypothetical protein